MREGGRIRLTTPTCQMTMMPNPYVVVVIESMLSIIRRRDDTNGSNNKISTVVVSITKTKVNGCSKALSRKKKNKYQEDMNYCKKHSVHF